MEKKFGVDPIWLTLGCLIGFTAAALLIIGLKISVIFDVLQKYQDIIGSLVGSVLTLGAAIPTIMVMQHQIQQTKDLENERRRRSNTAARAVLPLALREVSDYAEAHAHALMELHKKNAGVSLLPDGWKPLTREISSETISILRENIEFCDESAAGQISKLIVKTQIQSSRLEHRFPHRPNQGNLCIPTASGVGVNPIDGSICDALEIYVLTENLFFYARETPEYGPGVPTQDDWRSAANNLCRNEIRDPLGLREKLRSIAEQGFKEQEEGRR